MQLRRVCPLFGPYLVYLAAITAICLSLVDLFGGISEAVMSMVPEHGEP